MSQPTLLGSPLSRQKPSGLLMCSASQGSLLMDRALLLKDSNKALPLNDNRPASQGSICSCKSATVRQRRLTNESCKRRLPIQPSASARSLYSGCQGLNLLASRHSSRLSLSSKSSCSRLTSKSKCSPRQSFEVEEVIAKKDCQTKTGNRQSVTACQLALKHRLMLSEVNSVIRAFCGVTLSDAGGLDRQEFYKVMCRMFDVPKISRTVSEHAYLATGVAVGINFDNILAWYVQSMFTQINTLTADQDMASSNAMMYEVATKYSVSNIIADKMKSMFDHFDASKSGFLDFAEFQAMFCAVLKCDSDDVNPERIKRFWTQVDRNNDGGIDFGEFADWYLKYFNESDPSGAACPLEEFYRSFDPTVQRRQYLSGSRPSSATGARRPSTAGSSRA